MALFSLGCVLVYGVVCVGFMFWFMAWFGRSRNEDGMFLACKVVSAIVKVRGECECEGQVVVSVGVWVRVTLTLTLTLILAQAASRPSGREARSLCGVS